MGAQAVSPPAAPQGDGGDRGRDQGALRRAPAQVRIGPDHAGRAERPVRGQPAARGEAVRPRLRCAAPRGGGGRREAREEGQGPRPQRGQQQCAGGQSRSGNPHRRSAGQPAWAQGAGRGAAIAGDFLGQIATQVRESAARITDVRVRYPDYARFGRGRFDPQSVLSPLILLPPMAPAVANHAAVIPLEGVARAVPVSAVATVEPKRTPDEQVARKPAAGRHRHRRAERGGGRPRRRRRRTSAILDGGRPSAGRLSLGAGRPLPAAAGSVQEPWPGHGRGGVSGVHHARLPVPLGGAAAA